MHPLFFQSGVIEFDVAEAGDAGKLKAGSEGIGDIDNGVEFHDYFDEAAVGGDSDVGDASDLHAAEFYGGVEVKPLYGEVEVGGVGLFFFEPVRGAEVYQRSNCNGNPDKKEKAN